MNSQIFKNSIIHRVIAAALLCGAISAHGASETITLHYVEKPPYIVSRFNQEPGGIVASRATKVFKAAKIPYVWVKTSVARQFAVIKQNEGLDCAVGIESLPSRASFAKFSEPLYISQPVVALAGLKVTESEGVTLRQLLKKYTIIHREHSSLGEQVSAMISRSPNVYMTTVDTLQTAQLIAKGSGDFMLISKDVLDYYLEQGLLDPGSVRILSLPDLKVRFGRRIMCSKRVDDTVIEKLNQAISRK